MMKCSKYKVLTLLTFVLLVPRITSAHHSHVNLDRNNIQVYSGVVSLNKWVMPHVHLKIKGPAPQGELVEYVVELLHPPAMAERGWSRDTF